MEHGEINQRYKRTTAQTSLGERSATPGRVMITILIVLSVFRVGLFGRMPYYLLGDAFYDDFNQVQLATYLLSGQWLGPYGYTTLIKGISYPLFLAFCNVLSMPYPFVLGLFYLASAGLFCRALSKIFQSPRFHLIVYLILIYTPAGFDTLVTGRLYRNALAFPCVLLCLALILMTYLKRDEPIRKQVPWLIASGLAFLFFYYLREDSIWFLPFFIASLLIIGVWVIWFSNYDKKKKTLRCLVLLIPVAIWLLGSLLYMERNEAAYGVFATNDRVSGPFAEMAGNMIRVKNDKEEDSVYWISTDKLEKIIDSCPSLVEHKNVILDEMDELERTADGTRGDKTVWGIRIALNSLGYYSSAEKISEYCAQVNSEILDAVERGELEFDDRIHFSRQCRGIEAAELPGFLLETVRNIWEIITCKASTVVRTESSSFEEQNRLMESVACVNSIRASKRIYSGWMIWKDNDVNTSNIIMSVKPNDPNAKTIQLNRYDRSDVQAAFPQYNNALYSGFSIEAASPLHDNSIIQFYLDGRLIKETPFNYYEDDDVRIHFDQMGNNEDPNYQYSERFQTYASIFVGMERIISWILAPVSLLCFIILFTWYLRNRTWYFFEPVIVLSGLLLTITLFAGGITIFNSWLGPYNIWFYSSGMIPLFQGFAFLSLIYFLTRLRSIPREIGGKCDGIDNPDALPQ